MKVVHLSATDTAGGAARGAYSLHRALAGRLDSTMLVQRKISADPSVQEYRPRWSSALSRRVDHLTLRRFADPAELDFSPAILCRPVHRQINALAPDVVNLHWVNDGFLAPESMARVQAPLVWTLRDLWPATGGCHYSGSCQRFTTGCGHCPLLASARKDDLSSRLYRRKARAWAGLPLTLVALSRWLAGEARRSPLFAERDIVVIPNALDVQVFQPADRAQARAALGLPLDRRIILFGALNPLQDARKGFAAFARSLEVLAAREDHQQLMAVVFGPLWGPAPELALESRYLGAVQDDAHLALLYAAADVTAMPSLEEAFGKVAMESLACETPVVCFDQSGPADIVDHGVNGYLARHGDATDLARGLAWVLDHQDAPSLGRAGLNKVRDHYTYAVQASAYEQLYGRVLGQAAQRNRSEPVQFLPGGGGR